MAVVASHFHTTDWSIVVKAGSNRSSEANVALASLCESYWYPVYAFIRRLGHSADEAEDLTQEYFARFLEKGYAQDVDRQRGRFRTFLRTSVRNFLYNARDRERALKRGGGRPLSSLDVVLAEERYVEGLTERLTPEVVYDLNWAEDVLSRALQCLGRSLEGTERERLPALRPFLSGGDGEARYADLARRWEVAESTVRVAVFRLRKRFARILTDEIRRTVADEADVKDEVRYLLSALGRSRGR